MMQEKCPYNWTVEDVIVWARLVKLSDSTIQTLRQNKVDGSTLATLSREELQTELGIKSLPARRYLYDLICKIRSQQNSQDYLAALELHKNEIANLSHGQAPDTSGGVNKNERAVVNALMSDAVTQRQVLEDHLLALRLQNASIIGEQVFVDSDLATAEQKRLDKLNIISEFDHRFAAALNPQRQRNANRNEILSLFQLSMESCIRNRINVADALQSGKAKVLKRWQGIRKDIDEEIPEVRQETPTVNSQPTQRISRCNVCYNEDQKGYQLACDHQYCIDCLRNLFRTVLKDTSLLPIRCCEIPVDTSIADRLLSKVDVRTLYKRITEYEAVRKMYCPKCSEFINLDVVGSLNETLQCDCGALLCPVCATLAHTNISCERNQSKKADEDALILNLAEEKGWKRCPQCTNMIELKHGCNHMTCRCGHDFCFICLAPWNAATGLCTTGRCERWDENRLVEAAEGRVQNILGGQVVPVARRELLLRRETHALRNHEVCDHVWRRQNVRGRECERCSFELNFYGMVCMGVCRGMVCYTCANHRIPQRGWR